MDLEDDEFSIVKKESTEKKNKEKEKDKMSVNVSDSFCAEKSAIESSQVKFELKDMDEKSKSFGVEANSSLSLLNVSALCGSASALNAQCVRDELDKEAEGDLENNTLKEEKKQNDSEIELSVVEGVEADDEGRKVAAEEIAKKLGEKVEAKVSGGIGGVVTEIKNFISAGGGGNEVGDVENFIKPLDYEVDSKEPAADLPRENEAVSVSPAKHKSKNKFSIDHLPPKLDNEIEFRIENFYDRYINVSDSELTPHHVTQFFSDCLELPSVKFRLMVFGIAGGTSLPPPAERQMGAFVEILKKSDWPNAWVFFSVKYHIIVINQVDFRESVYRNDVFSFSNDETDRGWHGVLDHKSIVENGFLNENGDLVLRAGVFPYGAEMERLHRDSNYCSRAATGYVGLRNHGATCYMNSLMQSLYHIGKFRKAVYEMTFSDEQIIGKKALVILQKKKQELLRISSTSASSYGLKDEVSKQLDSDEEEDEDEEIYIGEWEEADIKEILQEEEEEKKKQPILSLALQNLFYRLYVSEDAVTCREIIRSFGWDAADAFTQHDTHELLKLLLDKIEEQMKDTPAEGSVKNMFEGEMETYIECMNINYKSCRRETFEDIQLDVLGCHDLEESLHKSLLAEILDGENMYDAEGFGKQKAKKGIRYLRLPSVLIFQLKRFSFDLQRMDTVKLNDRFEFSTAVDMSKFCEDAGEYTLHAVQVHQGDVNSGHYYVFIRPWSKNRWIKFDDDKVYAVSEYAAIGDNFGGEEVDCYNYLTSEFLSYVNNANFSSSHGNAFKPPGRSKPYSAYILIYVKKSIAKELLSPCNPIIVNPSVVTRCRMEEKLHDKRQKLKKELSQNVKVKLFVPEQFIGGAFLEQPYNIKPKIVRKFPRNTLLVEAWRSISDDLCMMESNNSGSNEANLSNSNDFMLFHVLSAENSFRFDRMHFAEGIKGRRNTTCTLQDWLKKVGRDLNDVYDPTLHVLGVREKNVIIRNVTEYDTYLASQTLIMAKYFDIFVENPTEQNLICLGYYHLHNGTRVRELEHIVLRGIYEAMISGRVASYKTEEIAEILQEYSEYINSNNDCHSTLNQNTFSMLMSAKNIVLKCAIELDNKCEKVDIRRSITQAKIYNGDILVWSIAPPEEKLLLKEKLAEVGQGICDEDDEESKADDFEEEEENEKAEETQAANVLIVKGGEEKKQKIGEKEKENELKNSTKKDAIEKDVDGIIEEEQSQSVVLENANNSAAAKSDKKNNKKEERGVVEEVEKGGGGGGGKGGGGGEEEDIKMLDVSEKLKDINEVEDGSFFHSSMSKSKEKDRSPDLDLKLNACIHNNNYKHLDKDENQEKKPQLKDDNEESFNEDKNVKKSKQRRKSSLPPPIAKYLILDFADYMDNKAHAVNINARLYNPLKQLGEYQNVSGKVIENEEFLSYRQPSSESLSDAAFLEIKTDGGKKLDLNQTNAVKATGGDLACNGMGNRIQSSGSIDCNPDDEDPYMHSPKGKPCKILNFQLDQRMAAKQVLKYIAWHLDVDPYNLFIYPEPPLLCSGIWEPLSIDSISVHENNNNNNNNNNNRNTQLQPSLHSLLQHLENCTRRGVGGYHSGGSSLLNLTTMNNINTVDNNLINTNISTYMLHLGLLPSVHTNWTKKPIPSSSDKNVLQVNFLVQFFNDKIECVGAKMGKTDYKRNDLGRTVSDFIEELREMIDENMTKKGLSKDAPLRLIDMCFPSSKFCEVKLDSSISVVQWFFSLQTKNIFACPLRIEPDFTIQQKSLIQQGTYKVLSVYHQTPDKEFFGHPFQILVKPNDTVSEIKKIIREKLQLPKNDWEKWSFFQFDWTHRLWKANDDTLDFANENVVLIAEHPMPYVKTRKNCAMRIA